MPEPRLDTLGCHKAGKSAPNPLDPELMSAKERLTEAASLLARGFLRARLRAAEKCQKGLAISRTSSHECPKPESEGESL